LSAPPTPPAEENKKGKENFWFLPATAGSGRGAQIGAYDLVSSHHARGACDIICFENRFELGTINTQMKNETVKIKPGQVETEEKPKIKKWSEEDLGFLLGDLIILQKNFSKNPEGLREKAIETYESIKDLFSDCGAEFYEDVQEIYKKYERINKPLVIRREDPIKITELASGKSIEFKFDPNVAFEQGDKYANSALWPHGPVNATTGLANAFLEGKSSAGPIVTVMAFKNNPEHITIAEPEGKMLEIGTITRQSVKIVSGVVTHQDLEFIIIRMPEKFFPKEELTERENKLAAENKLPQVFRGFRFIK